MSSEPDRHSLRIIFWLACTVAGVLVVLVPLGFFFLSYRHSTGYLETEARINATIITQIISANPDLWQYEKVRIEEYLSRRSELLESESRRIFDQYDKVIFEKNDELAPPTLTSSHVLNDSGVPVARLEIRQSLRPLIGNTLWLALAMMPLGVAAILALGVLPARSIRRQVDEALKREQDTAQQYLDIAGVILMATHGPYSTR